MRLMCRVLFLVCAGQYVFAVDNNNAAVSIPYFHRLIANQILRFRSINSPSNFHRVHRIFAKHVNAMRN